jgi:hypothetical protein
LSVPPGPVVRSLAEMCAERGTTKTRFATTKRMDPEPSAEDIALTRRLLSAGTLLGIEVLDHVILGEDGRHVSLIERGLL